MPDETRRRRSPLMVTALEECRRAPWCPAADVYHLRNGWLVKLDLAGVRPQEVQLQLSGRRLIVRGVRRDWLLDEGQRFYSLEISYNRFERAIELPVDVERSRLTTEYREGMLLVYLLTEAER